MNTKNQPHNQVICNVKAYVDEGIKDLVEELNRFNKLCTCDSCQGDGNKPATIFCEYGDNRQTSHLEVCEFVCEFVESFTSHINSIDCAGYKTHITIEWAGSKIRPLIEISLPSECIREVTNIVSLVRSDLENDI